MVIEDDEDKAGNLILEQDFINRMLSDWTNVEQKTTTWSVFRVNYGGETVKQHDAQRNKLQQ
jgi:hypothetical protein